MRLFAALPVSTEIREALREKVGRIGFKGDGVRWVDPSLWHVTLRFLGEVPRGELFRVTGTLEAATNGVAPFEWECRGLGGFPDLNRPRVLWAGVDRGRIQMVELAGRVEEALARAGFPGEGRPFHPHLTLGRAAGSARGRRGRRPAPMARRVLEAFLREEATLFGKASAREVLLVESRLRPEGPVYETVESWALSRL